MEQFKKNSSSNIGKTKGNQQLVFTKAVSQEINGKVFQKKEGCLSFLFEQNKYGTTWAFL